MNTLFISDLHLDASRPEITRLYLAFLAGEAREAKALYVLGDLFEAWIGDDATTEHDEQVIAGMRETADSGVPCYFMHGNRDFLVGEDFARRSGFRMLQDPALVNIDDEPVLLMHGDTMCTDDREYMEFRRMVRTREWQQAFLGKSIGERRAFAEHARKESMARGREKPMEIMDVNPAEVERVMREHGIRRLIHGHTHRPNVHRFHLDGEPAERIVLGDWYEQGSVLRVSDGNYRLESLSLDRQR
jgi:UDP-2,3-diacylglucosamine hydrolase